MAITSKIVYNGITVTLSAVLDGWYPGTPNASTKLVTDRLDLLLSGTTSELKDLQRAIRRAIEFARAHKADAPAWWYLTLADGIPEARTKITGGDVLFDARLANRLKQGRLKIGLVFEHEPGWEEAEAQIPLTNTNGSRNTSGLIVYNASDGAGSPPADRVNYVDIDGDDVAGDLLAACRLEITNSYNSASRTGALMVAHNVNSSPADMPHILEAEASTIGDSYAGAGFSGGYYTRSNWNDTAETVVFSWTLPTALLNASRGRRQRIVARWASTPDYGLITLRFRIAVSLNTIYTSPPAVLTTAALNQDLLTLQLPPYLQQSSDLYPLTLQMTAQHEQAGSHSLSLDFLQISPVDGWRVYQAPGFHLAYGARLVDDGLEETIYSDGWSTPGRVGHYHAFGAPLQLEPGRDQRIYFLAGNDTNGAENDRTHTIKLYYRPRRNAL